MNENPSSIREKLFDFEIWDVWPILRKQRSIVFLFLGTVVMATLIGALLTDKEYEATALIHLTPRTGQEVNMREVIDVNQSGYYEMLQFYRTQVHIVKSRSVREEVARRYQALGRDDMWQDFDADGFEGGKKLGSQLLVVSKEQSQLMNIHVQDTDPERAAILANLVAEIYAERNLELRQGSAREAKKWLQGEQAKYAENVDRLQKELLDFKSANNLIDVEENITSLESIMSSHNRRLGEVSTRRVVAEQNLRSYERLLESKNYDELARVMASPLLNQLASDRAASVQKDADLASKYGEKHPERRGIAAKLRSIEDNIEREVRKVIDGKRAEVAVVLAEERTLTAEVTALKQDLLRSQELETEYGELKYDLRRNEKFYEKLSERMDEVYLTSRTQLNNVYIIDAAIAPIQHIRPNIPVSLGVAVFIGLVGGCALALMREYVDDTITSHIDVTRHLEVPFLGLVPALPDGVTGRQADLFTHLQPRSSVAEAVRGLRAMLDLNPQGITPRHLLVTSSVAREGKTSTATRIAVAYSQMGRRVVIVDADLRKPRLHKVFGAPHDIGLTNYLLGAAEVDDILHNTVVPNLFAIYSGPGTDHPTELLSSPYIDRLISDLDERFDMVLFDTPPSVALSDAVALSPKVDGVVLVVREHAVSKHVVKRTVDTFKQVNATILGVILNGVDVNRGGLAYKYYYAYRDYHYNYEPREGDDNSGSTGAAAK